MGEEEPREGEGERTGSGVTGGKTPVASSGKSFLWGEEWRSSQLEQDVKTEKIFMTSRNICYLQRI